MKKTEKLSGAIDALASVIVNGALQVATDPAAFLLSVRDTIVLLRKLLEQTTADGLELQKAVDLAHEAHAKLESELQQRLREVGRLSHANTEIARLNVDLQQKLKSAEEREAALEAKLERAIEVLQAVRRSNMARGHAACDEVLPELLAAQKGGAACGR